MKCGNGMELFTTWTMTMGTGVRRVGGREIGRLWMDYMIALDDPTR